jgi:hypothetical protein
MGWHGVVVIGELFITDCAFPALLHNLAIQESTYPRRPQQQSDLWIGHNSLLGSLIAFPWITVKSAVGLGVKRGRRTVTAMPGGNNSCRREINVRSDYL